jgi:hypothetical protein
VTSGMGAVSTSAIPNLCSETLTDGAGGFFPGVSLGCLRMWGPGSELRPRPFGETADQGPRPREDIATLRWQSNAGRVGSFLGRKAAHWASDGRGDGLCAVNLLAPVGRRP